MNFVSDSRILSSDAAALTMLPAQKLLTRTVFMTDIINFVRKETNKGSYRQLNKVITYNYFFVNMIGLYTSVHVHTECGKRLFLPS